MRKLTFLDGFMGLAFLVALAIRLTGLGSIPLNDSEAKWAFQALELARGGSTVGAETGVILWSSLLFGLLGGSNFLARFIPAFIGSWIVFTPIFFQKKIGYVTTVIFSFGLALDPLLVGISRQVDGLSMSITLAFLAAGFWYWRKDLMFGLCLGIYLITGPSAWLGLTILGVIVLVNRIFLSEKKDNADLQKGILVHWKSIFLGLGISLFVFGTLLMFTPTGISGALEGLVAYWNSWKGNLENQYSAGMIIMAVLNYLLMPVLLGISGMIQGIRSKNKEDLKMTAWVLSTLLVLIIYPGFEIRHLAWISPLFWIIAARQISKISWKPRKGPSLLMGVVTLVMMVFILINFNTLVNSLEPGLRLSAIGISFLIILLTGFLVWWGWSFDEARFGFGLGVLIILMGLTFAGAWRSAGLNGKINLEMTNLSPAFVDSDLMDISIGDLSEWNTGEREFLDVVSLGVQSPAVDWMMRDLVNYQKVNSITAGENPDIIIAASDAVLGQTELYTGQEFTLREIPIWDGLTARQWIGWLMRRELMVNQETILLWVRSDLFPGTTSNKSTGE